MAGERTLPGIGLTGFWDIGSAYKTGMDDNLRLVSALLQARILSQVAAEPGAPVDGDMHAITGGANAGKIAIRDAGAWVYVTPKSGWIVYDVGLGEHITFNGVTWDVLAAAGGGGGGAITLANVTAALTLTNVHLAGGVFLRMNVAGANNISIPAGLTGTEPVTFLWESAGQPTFVPAGGVTLLSPDSKTKMRVAGSQATLVPLGADKYSLIGDISA